MLVAIGKTGVCADEIDCIGGLLDVGLDKYHIRKQGDVGLVESLLERLDGKYHSSIVVHGCSSLKVKFQRVNFHIPSYERTMESSGYSTSVHSIREYHALKTNYNYLFCSPVFDSISKKGYKANQEWQSRISEIDARQMIALGGVCENNLGQIKYWGYQHLAISGALWNSNDAVKAFESIKKLWEKKEI